MEVYLLRNFKTFSPKNKSKNEVEIEVKVRSSLGSFVCINSSFYAAILI
jgi:hypothetical protein